MIKRMLLLMTLLGIATALFAQSKPEFSLRIHTIGDNTFAVRDDITLEVTTTNLTDHRLDFMKYGKPYTYIVRRDGVPAPMIPRLHPDMIMVDPKGLPPHRSITGNEYVQRYVDMSQPGKYTIRLQEGDVKSNVVTVTVEP